MKNIPLFKVFVDVDNAMSNIKEVLSSGFLNEGEQVIKFQKELEDRFGTDQIVLTNSCTSALTLALHLSNVGVNDHVYTTPMTCVASNTIINNLKAVPHWIDIDSNTGMLSPQNLIEELKKRNKFQNKAVLSVNWAGTPNDLELLNAICTDYGSLLIQDAAHSFGAKYLGTDISKYADFTAYSFQAIKHLTTGDGGCLVVRDRKLWERAKKLKWFGIDRDTTKDAKGEWKGQRWEIDIEEAGYKFNMNNIDAAIGLANIKHVDDILLKHRTNASIYANCFSKSNVISPLKIPTGATSSYWVYTALYTKQTKISRDDLLKKLNELGIHAGLVHVPNDNYTCFNLSKKDLPGVRSFETSQISLPCGWWISPVEIKEIANTILELVL